MDLFPPSDPFRGLYDLLTILDELRFGEARGQRNPPPVSCGEVRRACEQYGSCGRSHKGVRCLHCVRPWPMAC